MSGEIIIVCIKAMITNVFVLFCGIATIIFIKLASKLMEKGRYFLTCLVFGIYLFVLMAAVALLSYFTKMII